MKTIKSANQIGKTHAMKLEQCKRNLCPECGSDQIEGQEIEIMQGTARQDVNCASCDAEWAEFYVMNDFSLYGKATK